MILDARRLLHSRLAALGALIIFALGVRFALAGPDDVAVTAQLSPIRQVPGVTDRVSLTFDLAWGDRNPLLLLEALDAAHVQATFFVAGPWAASHPETLRRMVTEGHDVGSLGHRQVDLTAYPRDIVREEIQRGYQAIADAAGVPPYLFRPPSGLYDANVLEEAHQARMTTVLHNLDTQDWMNPGREYIVRRVLDRARGGDIVLLQASDQAAETPAALPGILRALQSKGLKPVPVRDLLGLTPPPG